jgi:Antitoxin Xre/MbcA/ParS C-terminal toxin-binding domain/Antitoxin Xre-like helix-turn-helix domain
MRKPRGMQEQAAQSRPRVSADAVLGKAVLRAADRLDLSNAVLARVLGISGPTMTRMRQGGYTLEHNGKAFELATLFVRVWRALDAIVGGDDAVASKWLRADNIALGGRPADLIQKITGLFDVLHYLDARRALS